jgi:hypothetical protein
MDPAHQALDLAKQLVPGQSSFDVCPPNRSRRHGERDAALEWVLYVDAPMRGGSRMSAEGAHCECPRPELYAEPGPQQTRCGGCLKGDVGRRRLDYALPWPMAAFRSIPDILSGLAIV